MDFLTEKARAAVERDCDHVQSRIVLWQENLTALESVTKGKPYIKKRFDHLAAMSRKEMLQEIEADYTLFCGGKKGGLRDEKGEIGDVLTDTDLESIKSDFEYFSGRILTWQKAVDVVEDFSRERPFIMNRFKTMVAMLDSGELAHEIESDYVLLGGTVMR